LKKTLVFRNGMSPLGLLAFCLDYSKSYFFDIGGIFKAIKDGFSKFNETDLHGTISDINEFRNQFVAHQEQSLTDVDKARDALIKWIIGLYKIYSAHN
jgi:type III restriction enzyme